MADGRPVSQLKHHASWRLSVAYCLLLVTITRDLCLLGGFFGTTDCIMPTSPDPEQPSPSHERRLALRQADAGNTIRVLDCYPLTKYFDMARRLLDAFQTAVDERRLDEAYVYGLRFAAFSLESLPRHKDWKLAGKHSQQKRRNAQQVDKVLSMMETIKQRMDAEELVRQQERVRLQKQRQEEEEERNQRNEAQRKRLEEEQRRALEEKRQLKKAQSKKNVEQSAMAKLQAMMGSSKPAERPKDEAVEKPQVEIPISVELLSSEEKKTESDDSKSSDQTSSEFSGTPAMPTVNDTAASGKALSRPPNKEQATIDTLDRAIQANNKILDKIENREIPKLLKAARVHLQQPHAKGSSGSRKAALQCLARKKALERQADVMKAANFNMETQIFMLENAMEDRQVEQMLQEAAQAMKMVNESAGVDPAINLSDVTAASLSLHLFGEEEDEEGLLQELHEWVSPSALDQVQTNEGDDVSILSLPTIPASVSSKEEEPSLIRNRPKKAVLE